MCYCKSLPLAVRRHQAHSPADHSEVTSRGRALGHLTLALCEVSMNLAPFVTSFSTWLMASRQLYGRHVLLLVMQHNYTGPDLMNKVNVSPAALTSLACDLLSPSMRVKQRLSHFTPISCTVVRKKKKKRNAIIGANQECID